MNISSSVVNFIFFVVIMLLVVWSLIWKGLALWKAARLGHRNWFIALLIINTLGILDILYLYIFSKPKPHDVESRPKIASEI